MTWTVKVIDTPLESRHAGLSARQQGLLGYAYAHYADIIFEALASREVLHF